LKNIVPKARGNQNTGDTIKKLVFFHFFFNDANFVENTFSRKKNTHPILTKVLIKKFEPDMSYHAGEKGKNFKFLFENLILRKPQRKFHFSVFQAKYGFFVCKTKILGSETLITPP
jgi:hypothetical protein